VLKYDFDQSVGCWINMANLVYRKALDVELNREGITFRQFEVLAWLVLKGELSQSELADRMNIEAPTLAGIIERMEQGGWIERRPCCDDKRRKRLRPTERADAVWTRMVDCCLRVRARATQGIAPEELAVMKSVCERIRENLAAEETEAVEDEPAFEEAVPAK
jgi:MarR family transcriptional regulator for hemolysin